MLAITMNHSVKYLRTILHATHGSRGTSLHSHWVSLGTWWAITLARVTRPLLWTCGRPLLRLLTVWTACSIWLTSHFSHWVHGTRRLTMIRTRENTLTTTKQDRRNLNSPCYNLQAPLLTLKQLHYAVTVFSSKSIKYLATVCNFCGAKSVKTNINE